MSRSALLPDEVSEDISELFEWVIELADIKTIPQEQNSNTNPNTIRRIPDKKDFVARPSFVELINTIDYELRETVPSSDRETRMYYLGTWSFFSQYAIPTLLHYRHEHTMTFPVIRICVRMLTPIRVSDSQSIQRLRHQQMAKAEFSRPEVMQAILSLLVPHVQQLLEGKHLSSEDEASLELYIALVTFLLGVPDIANPSSVWEANLHERFVVTAEQSHFYDFLLALCGVAVMSKYDVLSLRILEALHSTFRSTNGVEVAEDAHELHLLDLQREKTKTLQRNASQDKHDISKNSLNVLNVNARANHPSITLPSISANQPGLGFLKPFHGTSSDGEMLQALQKSQMGSATMESSSFSSSSLTKGPVVGISAAKGSGLPSGTLAPRQNPLVSVSALSRNNLSRTFSSSMSTAQKSDPLQASTAIFSTSSGNSSSSANLSSRSSAPTYETSIIPGLRPKLKLSQGSNLNETSAKDRTKIEITGKAPIIDRTRYTFGSNSSLRSFSKIAKLFVTPIESPNVPIDVPDTESKTTKATKITKTKNTSKSCHITPINILLSYLFDRLSNDQSEVLQETITKHNYRHFFFLVAFFLDFFRTSWVSEASSPSSTSPGKFNVEPVSDLLRQEILVLSYHKSMDATVQRPCDFRTLSHATACSSAFLTTVYSMVSHGNDKTAMNGRALRDMIFYQKELLDSPVKFVKLFNPIHTDKTHLGKLILSLNALARLLESAEKTGQIFVGGKPQEISRRVSRKPTNQKKAPSKASKSSDEPSEPSDIIILDEGDEDMDDKLDKKPGHEQDDNDVDVEVDVDVDDDDDDDNDDDDDDDDDDDEEGTTKRSRIITELARKQLKFDTAEFIESLTHPAVIRNFFYILRTPQSLPRDVLRALLRLLQRIAFQQSGAYLPMFYQLSILITAEEILQNPWCTNPHPTEESKALTELLKKIIREYFRCAQRNPLVFVETLFWKNAVSCIYVNDPWKAACENAEKALVGQDKSREAQLLELAKLRSKLNPSKKQNKNKTESTGSEKRDVEDYDWDEDPDGRLIPETVNGVEMPLDSSAQKYIHSLKHQTQTLSQSSQRRDKFSASGSESEDEWEPSFLGQKTNNQKEDTAGGGNIIKLSRSNSDQSEDLEIVPEAKRARKSRSASPESDTALIVANKKTRKRRILNEE